MRSPNRRVDVLGDRKPATVTEWLREHPGVEVVCRDGSADAEAIRQRCCRAPRHRSAGLDQRGRGQRPAPLHGFVRGLRKDLPAAVAGLSLPDSNDPAEGVNTKVKLLKRQMYGQAGFALLRKRILLS